MLFCGMRSSLACAVGIVDPLGRGVVGRNRERAPEKPFHGRLLGGTVGVGVPGLWRLSGQIGPVQHYQQSSTPPHP
jgi:hypothetical protein